MNRLRIIRIALMLSVAAASAGNHGAASDAARSDAVRADPPRRPNVLLIFTDDESYRTLSCYRAEGAWPWVRTPHIDRLAKEGVRFTDMYGAAWCTPSRSCLLTGLLPHGIRGMHINAVLDGRYDPDVCRFWPTELRKGGYQTAMIGKWHVGHDSGHGRVWDHSVVWDQADIKGDWYNDQILSIDGAPNTSCPVTPPTSIHVSPPTTSARNTSNPGSCGCVTTLRICRIRSPRGIGRPTRMSTCRSRRIFSARGRISRPTCTSTRNGGEVKEPTRRPSFRSSRCLRSFATTTAWCALSTRGWGKSCRPWSKPVNSIGP